MASRKAQIEKVLAARGREGQSDAETAWLIAGFLTVDDLANVPALVTPNTAPELIELVRALVLDREHLDPADSFFNETIATYFATVTLTLLPETDATTRLSVVCLPSFEREWAVRLVGSAGAGYQLAARTADADIWPRQEVARLPSTLSIAAIPEEVAAGLTDAWRMMVERARRPSFPGRGLDGRTYHFSFGGATAQTWSPVPHTAPGRLVALAELLYQYARQKGRSESLLAQISDASQWFQRHADRGQHLRDDI